MKPQYINIALMPPEDPPTKRELDREEFEQAAIKYCSTLRVKDVFDLHDHDKEVVKAFSEWLEKNVMLYGGLWTDDTNPYDTEAKIYSFDQMWELFNSPNNDLPLHEGEEFKL